MILEIRNATLSELTENELGLIQRRIFVTSNEILEEPILLESGFRIINSPKSKLRRTNADSQLCDAGTRG